MSEPSVTLPTKLKWRVGRTVPINVYEGDRPVCQCHTGMDAAGIVKAMNATIGNLRKFTQEELNAAKATAAGLQREAIADWAYCERGRDLEKEILALPLADWEAEKWLQGHDTEVTRKADELTIQEFIQLLGSKDNTFPLKFCNKGIGVALDKYLTHQLAEARAEAYRRCARETRSYNNFALCELANQMEQWATEAASPGAPAPAPEGQS